MPYADPGAVRAALDPSGSETGPGSAAEMTTPALEKPIAQAQDVIDARLRGRYTVPFGDPPPGLIKDICVAIAAYRASLTWRQGSLLDDRHPVWLAYQDALQLLDGLAEGTVLLPDDGTDPAPGTDPGGVHVVNRYRGDLFTPDDFGLGYSTRRAGRCG